MNNSAHLVHMANQIAAFYAPYSHEEAVAGVASHITRFWEKRMRRQLDEHIEHGAADLNPIVVEAVARLHQPA